MHRQPLTENLSCGHCSSSYVSPPPLASAAAALCIFQPSLVATSRRASLSHGLPCRAGWWTHLRTIGWPCQRNARACLLLGRMTIARRPSWTGSAYLTLVNTSPVILVAPFLILN